MTTRDYSLLGPDAQRAVATGLAAAEWYHTEVPRKVMKELMQRSDQPAIRDTALYYGLMILFAVLGIALWPTWWSAPFWLAYGVLYGSASDSRWHECQHGTAFKTKWMNEAVYQIACFMIVRNPAAWRWSHARHHTDTYIVGRDPEIAIMRPTEFTAWKAFFSGGAMRFGTFLFFVGLFYHTWIGMRSILMDYAKPTSVRLAADIVVALVLIGEAGWAISILWRP